MNLQVQSLKVCWVMNEAFEKFYNVTGYDIKSYFQKFVDFCTNDYPLIVDYYSNGGEMDKDSFLRLVELVRESETIEPLFILHENTLDDISMWEILDNFTETQTKLSTIKSSARWLRSSSLDRNNTLQMEKTLRTGERFEDVARQLNSSNPEGDWMNITIPQYTQEKNYVSTDSYKQYFASWWNRIWEVLEDLAGIDSGSTENRTSLESLYVNLRTNLFPDPDKFIKDYYQSYTEKTGSIVTGKQIGRAHV